MLTANVKGYKSPVTVYGLDGRPRWNEVWEHNPRFVKEDGFPHIEGPGRRPYIEEITLERFYWRKGQVSPGELYFGPGEQEKLASGSYLVIEPNIKRNVNKAWGGFQRVADSLNARFVQCDYGQPLLDGVETVKTASFRDACRVIRDSQGLVSVEGGMHHAAAALGKPAVVIFGGFIHPDVTGYEFHTNIGGGMCGARQECAHCKAELDAISPDFVVEKIVETFPLYGMEKL